MAQQRGDDKAEHPAVTVCVIAYNSGPTLRTCLEHLGAQTFRDFEVLVIDNDSPDPGDAAIAAEFPWARLVRNARNVGFTGAGNQGAREGRGRWYVLLNPDAYAEPDWLEKLVWAQVIVEANDAGIKEKLLLIERMAADLRMPALVVHGSQDPMIRVERAQLARGGRHAVTMVPMPASVGYYKAGTLRALGVSTLHRSSALPDVPPLADAVPGYEALGWYAVATTKGAPADVIERLSREIGAIDLAVAGEIGRAHV